MHSVWFGWIVRICPPLFSIGLILGLSALTAKLRFTEGLSTWFCFFIPIQIFLNWIQFLRHRSFVPVSTDNYPGYVHKNPTMWYGRRDGDRELEDQATQNIRERYKDCLSCNLHVPIRSHHCPYCRKCIYILDHHCFFLGHCVGRKNLKFFLVFCFYSSLGCGLGVYHVMGSMSNYRDITSREAMFFFLPFSLVMFFTGKIQTFEAFNVSLINFGFGACVMSLFLFLLGIISILRGTTPYEARKNIVEKEKRNFTEKFSQVFGTMGLLHFLFPLLPFEEPYIEPGYRRLIGPQFT